LKTIVVYKSKYGSSKQYALWIAEELKCTVEKAENINIQEILSYDVIIYVGGLYAGGVNGFKQIRKHLSSMQDKKLLLCMVGATNPSEKGKYHQVYLNNVPEQYQDIVKPFSLRGDQLMTKMSGIHRLMMKFPKAELEKIPENERTAEDIDFLEHFGEDKHFVERDYITSVVEYVKNESGIQNEY